MNIRKSAVFASMAIGLLSHVALAAAFGGGASGSLESGIICMNDVPEGDVTGGEIVSTKSLGRSKSGGFIDQMTLTGAWFEENGKRHFADFEVLYVRRDDSAATLTVIGKSQGGNYLDLVIFNGRSGDHRTRMFINAIPQTFGNLQCNAPISG